jgi:hypothetical protein
MSSFEMLPDDVIYLIFSYISPPEVNGIARLYQTVGRVSKFFRNRVKGFVQASSIEFKVDWRQKQKPYRTIAWLCNNHVRIGKLEIVLTSNYLNAFITKYMIEKCDLTDLGAVTILFCRGYYDSTGATEAGIPRDVMNNAMERQELGECDTIGLKKGCLQAICDKANKMSHLSFTLWITVAGDACAMEFMTSQLVKLQTLQNLHLRLILAYDLPPIHFDFAILSKGIESLNNLENLTLYIPGNCEIRSKTLRQLEYSGEDEGELVQCECPSLESMVLYLMKPISPHFLSSFSHSITKLCIYCDFDLSPRNTKRLTDIIRAMPSLEELTFGDGCTGMIRMNQYLGIESKSLRRINLLSSKKFFCLSFCICPKLEMIECNVHHPTMQCPLVPVDDGIFNSLVKLWNNDSLEKVFTFLDCPFKRCEIPDSCSIKLILNID